MLLKKELILIGVESDNADNAIVTAAQPFVSAGYAKPTFPQAVADRELMYATGLPAAGMDIAMPHAARDHVTQTAVGIATLKSDVTFRMMGDPSTTLHPKILFTLAIAEAHAELAMIQRIMAMLEDGELLAACCAATTPDELYDLMAERIG